MPRVKEHLHKWKNDLTCRCGETHPLIMQLRQRIEDMEHQEFPSIVIDDGYRINEEEKAEELSRWPSSTAVVHKFKFGGDHTGESVSNSHLLDSDLQAIVDEKRQSPQVRAKMARYAFGARGWPNEEHPGTVRDFLEEHGVPIIAENSISTRQEK